ncbi:hypothetical protein BGZ96_007952 [Linnemannia gamsii]|uniref:C2H2-type domain-containing protein n=1 Tax=Linnemannia gamsii TaxID=64522 RepID=A0ABQ7K0F1_9FUNG|nr:hypothetical protein BGZ96_007952 [Linnemannia gamsii]
MPADRNRSRVSTKTVTGSSSSVTDAESSRPRRHVTPSPESAMTRPSSPVAKVLTQVSSPTTVVRETPPPLSLVKEKSTEDDEADVTLPSYQVELPTFPWSSVPEDRPHTHLHCLHCSTAWKPSSQLEIHWNETVTERILVTQKVHDYSIPGDRRDEHRSSLFYLQRLERSLREGIRRLTPRPPIPEEPMDPYQRAYRESLDTADDLVNAQNLLDQYLSKHQISL